MLIAINGEDRGISSWTFRALERGEDTKNFWKGKKYKQVTYSLWGNSWLKNRSFLFAKPQINKVLFITQWLKCSELEETHISQKGVFPTKSCHFLLKRMLNYNQKILKLVSQPFSLMRLLFDWCHKSEQSKDPPAVCPGTAELKRVRIRRSLYRIQEDREDKGPRTRCVDTSCSLLLSWRWTTSFIYTQRCLTKMWSNDNFFLIMWDSKRQMPSFGNRDSTVHQWCRISHDIK